VESERIAEIRAFIFTGATFATLFSAIAVVVTMVAPGTPRKAGLSLWQIVGAYYVGGLSGGAILGLLLPFARTRIGAPIVGFLTMLPLAFSLFVSMIKRSEWFPAGLVMSTIFALLFGAGIGAVIQSQSKQ
jgi:hypothetical protein